LHWDRATVIHPRLQILEAIDVARQPVCGASRS